MYEPLQESFQSRDMNGTSECFPGVEVRASGLQVSGHDLCAAPRARHTTHTHDHGTEAAHVFCGRLVFVKSLSSRYIVTLNLFKDHLYDQKRLFLLTVLVFTFGKPPACYVDDGCAALEYIHDSHLLCDLSRESQVCNQQTC